MEPLQAAFASEPSHLIEALIFLLLLLDVEPHRSLIPSDGGYPVSARLKVLPNKVPALAPIRPRDVDCTLALQIPHHLRHRILRRDSHKHMDMIAHQVPFLNLAFLLPGHLPKHLSQVPTQLPKERLAPIFRNEYNLVFAFPFRVIQTFAYIHFESPVVEPGRFTTRILKTTPGAVKLRESPGRAGGLPNDYYPRAPRRKIR